MASEIERLLGQEIQRIVRCAYPTQLKTLHDLLLKASDLDIEAWAVSHPCHIPALVAEILPALEHWGYVLDIITKIAPCAEIRDEILRQRPLLLPGVLDKAVGNGAETKYVRAAVALLKQPLPASIPLPAAAQDLLCQTFERAARDQRALGTVYTLLRGGCQPLLGVVGKDVLERFEKLVKGVLPETSEGDPLSAMYCLSIMRIMIEGYRTVTQSASQRLTLTELESDLWNPAAMTSFFEGVKANKTILLSVMRVISACKAGLGATANAEAYECVKLANYVLAAIGYDIRSEWAFNNKAVLRKLLEKASHIKMSSDLRLQVLTFVVSLLPRGKVPVEISCELSQYLGSRSLVTISLQDFSDRLQGICDDMDASSNNVDCTGLVQAILTGSTPRNQSVLEFRMLLAIMESLIEAMSYSANIRRAVLVVATSKKLPLLLQNFEVNKHTSGLACCDATLSKLLGQMGDAIRSLVLHAALSATEDEPRLPFDLIQTLLRRPVNSNMDCSVCEAVKKRSIDHILVHTPATDLEAVSGNWRENLSMVLQQQRQQQDQSVISAVASICQSLEDRCTDIEGPLRVERQQREELEKKYSELEEAYGTLEGQLMDRDLRISALDSESDQVLSKIDELTEEKSTLIQRIEDAEDRLRRTSEESRNLVDALRREKDQADMEYATFSAQKQDDVDSMRRTVDSLRHDLDSAQTKIEEHQHTVNQSSLRIKALEDEKHDMERGIVEGNSRLAGLEKHLDAVTSAHRTAQEDLQAHQRMIVESKKESESLHVELEEARTEGRQALSKLGDEMQSRMANERQQWRDEQNRLEQQLDETRQDQAEMQAGYEAEQQSITNKVHDQKKKIERLTKELIKKDAQIAEAQEMRNRLVSAMGLNLPAGSPPKQSSLPFRSASTAGTPCTQPPRTPARESTQAELGGDIGDLSLDSAASSQHAPTPKRAKPRRAFKAPSLQQPRLNTGLRSAKSALRTGSTMKRQPLGQIPANRSPIRPGRSPSKVAFKSFDDGKVAMSTDGRNAVADFSFNTDVLTSTPGIGRNTAHDLDDFDGSTADV